MIDNEIAKALECCMGCACKECPYCDDYAEECMGKLIVEALKLVNRQKAKIERLKEAYAVYEETTGLKWARAEAIKEFAERLKGYPIKCPFPLFGLASRTEIEDYSNGILMQVRDAIDNLVKEMTEDAKHD